VYRKIAWKHLLNVYPAGMTGGERIRYLRDLSQTYAQLKADWMDLVLQVIYQHPDTDFLTSTVRLRNISDNSRVP
jgi:hypothetical protein